MLSFFVPDFFELAFFGVMALMLFSLWIRALVDCVRNEPSEGNDKLIWVLVILLASWLGAIIYLYVRRPERIKKHGK